MDFDFDSLALGPCHDIFGTAVTYTPPGGVAMSVVGIFDAAFNAVTIGDDGVPFTTVMPVVGVRLSQWPVQPVQDGVVTYLKTGARYVVKEVRPDGHGEAKLMLNRMA